jgi:hypothetical protein
VEAVQQKVCLGQGVFKLRVKVTTSRRPVFEPRIKTKSECVKRSDGRGENRS